VTHITALYGLPPDTKWVTFGGSYPGMMAGWLRLKYPHLVHASVSSSAPVQAALEMRGYNDVVAASLADADVGGSEACVGAVQAAFAALSTELSTPAGRRRVETHFNVCALTHSSEKRQGDEVLKSRLGRLGRLAQPGQHRSDRTAPVLRQGNDLSRGQHGSGSTGGDFPLDDPPNRMELVAALSEVFPAQSNDPACSLPACDIRAACAVMIHPAQPSQPNSSDGGAGGDSNGGASSRALGATPLERLAALASIAFGGECVDVDNAAGMRALNTTALPPDYAKGGGDFERSWFWQTCTEFGFYQTCVPGSACPFLTDPPLLTVRSFTDVCAAVFPGVDFAGVVAPAADRANERTVGLSIVGFGGLDLYDSGRGVERLQLRVLDVRCRTLAGLWFRVWGLDWRSEG